MKRTELTGIRRIGVLVAALAAFAVLPGGTAETAEGRAGNAELITSCNPKGSILVMIIDTSMSMRRTDKKRFNVEGARLAVAISNKGDNVGVVRFSTKAHVHVPLRTLDSVDDRQFCMQQLSKVPLEGLTNFVLAVRKTKEMLLAAKAPKGASVMFLTDGRPETEDREKQKIELMEEVQTFIEHGWRIYTIAFTDEAEEELLKKMAVSTGGAYFQEEKPEGLLKAFLKVSSDVYNFLMFTGDPKDVTKPVAVMEGSKRLVYILIKYTKRSGATIGRLTRNGENFPFTGPNVYRFPGKAGEDSFFEVTHLFDPPAGVYQATLNGNPKEAAILNHPPFDIAIMKNCPKKQYRENEPVECGIEIACPLPDVLKKLKEKGTVEASFYNNKTKGAVKTIKLEDKSIKENKLFFQGRTRLSLPEDAAAATFTIRLKFKFDLWTHEKAVSIDLLPDPAKLLSVYPNKIDLGSMWTDKVEFARMLRLETTFPDHFDVSAFTTGSLFDIQPGKSSVTQIEGATFKLTPKKNAAFKPGLIDAAVVFKAASGDGKIVIPEKRVPITGTFAELAGPETIALGVASRASKANFPFKLDVLPESIDFSLEPDTPVGPKNYTGISPIIKKGEKGFFLYKFDVPADAPLGAYKGKITVRPADGRLGPREREVTFEVKANTPKLVVLPDKIRISSTRKLNGWEERKITVKLVNFYRPWKVTFKTGPLNSDTGGVLDDRYDVRIEPDGWDGGKPVEPGKEYALAFRVYVYSDLANGTYRGQVDFEMKNPDPKYEKPLIVTIPVTVDIKR